MRRAKPCRGKSRIRTCADYGGLSLNGTACNHAAGFGTPHPGEGRCRKHNKVSDAIVQALKKTFTQRLEETSFRQACKAVDRDPTTIWRWRKADHEFDIAMTQARRMRDELDVAEVEQTLVGRCIAGTATSAETIFFLVNRSAGRWRHVQRIEHAGDPDRPVQVHHELDQLTLSEKIELLRGIVARYTGPNSLKKERPA